MPWLYFFGLAFFIGSHDTPYFGSACNSGTISVFLIVETRALRILFKRIPRLILEFSDWNEAVLPWSFLLRTQGGERRNKHRKQFQKLRVEWQEISISRGECGKVPARADFCYHGEPWRGGQGSIPRHKPQQQAQHPGLKQGKEKWSIGLNGEKIRSS